MKRSLLVLAVLLAFIPAEAAMAQTEITARGASIRVGGRLHAQYQSSSAEGSEADFFIRRARLTLDVTVNDFLSARLMPDFSGGTAELQDAYFRLTFADQFRVSMGQFKRPFDLFELSSSTDMGVIERDGRVDGVDSCSGVGKVCSYGRFSSSLGLGGRDQGILAEVTLDRLSFSAAMTNGTGINTSDDNNDKTYIGRATFSATDKVTVGGALAAKDYVDGDSNEYANIWSLDAQYGGYRGGLLLQGAVLGGDNWKNPDADTGDATTFLAWQAMGSYYFPVSGQRFVGWEPVLRVSAGDPDTALDDDGGLVFTPGLMLYVQGRNRIGVNVDYYTPQTGDAEWSLKIQSFLYF